ncbi:hypothetical protein ROLI_012940 [Roseobacter fucihabitans]|uniref:Uncharacterized protein n=1 Tax=Roseobacter fucihabitans TaxID=1537242 RepID=A0ABZ2BQF6_9RHOB|nr:hypothetical protein [Roseobacter litoralis]
MAPILQGALRVSATVKPGFIRPVVEHVIRGAARGFWRSAKAARSGSCGPRRAFGRYPAGHTARHRGCTGAHLFETGRPPLDPKRLGRIGSGTQTERDEASHLKPHSKNTSAAPPSPRPGPDFPPYRTPFQLRNIRMGRLLSLWDKNTCETGLITYCFHLSAYKTRSGPL